MKKVSTAAMKGTKNFSQPKLTIGLDLGGRSAGCADAGAVGENRCAVVVSGETSQRESAGGSDGDPGASRVGASADGAGEHGAWAGQVVWRAAAGMQCAQYESGESGRAEPGVASGAAALAGGNRVAERTHPRVQRRDRKAGAGKLSAGGAAKAGQRSRHADRADVPADAGGCPSLSQEPRRGLLS